MTFKSCPACDQPFLDKDKVIAFMPSRYREIDSEVHYAVEQPTRCYAIVHWECFAFPFGEYHEPEEN